MSIRTRIGNWLIVRGRKFGRKEGQSELAVFLDDHSIKTRMVDVDRDDLAWDDNLYRHGCVFIRDYANPIKPTVTHRPELEEPDTVDVEEADAVESEDKADVIASDRYKSYMKQELVESLLNPKEQWKLIAYAIIGLAILTAMNLVVNIMATGAV